MGNGKGRSTADKRYGGVVRWAMDRDSQSILMSCKNSMITWPPPAKALCGVLAMLSVLLILFPEARAARPETFSVASIKEKFDLGKYQEIIALLKAALAQEPQNSSLAFWLMRGYYELDMMEEAVTYGERAVNSEPSNSDYHLWLGRAYGRKAEKGLSFSFARKTRAEFEKAVELDSSNLPARRDLMEFYLEAPWVLGGGKDKGWRQAEAIAEIDPVEGCLARGFYWRNLGKLDSAEAEYARVLESKPKRIEPYFEVADFYLKHPDGSRLEAAIEAAADIEARDCRLDYYRGVAGFLSRKDLGSAEQYLKTYLSTAPPRHDLPSRASAHVWLGRIYEQQAQRGLSAEQYKAALELEPGRKDAREGLRRTSRKP